MGSQHRDEPQNGHSNRGQTTIDFAIGVSVFLAVLLFIFLFLPGILSPFTASAQDETVSANRAADQLASGMLASPSEPYVLDSYCTVAFFENKNADCQFQKGNIESQLGVDTTYQFVNVSLRGNLTAPSGTQEYMCWDGDGPDTGLVNTSTCDESPGSDDPDDTHFTRGDPVPTSQASVTSVRVVTIDGHDVTLYVEMW